MGLPDPLESLLRVGEYIRDVDRLEPLDGYQSELVTLIRELLADGVDVLYVTRTIADANDALTTRLLGLAVAELGRPPARYSWLALGSHGRGEQVLSSDQDSALAYDASPAAQTDAVAYFGQLAHLVVDALARAGLPRCAGGYMATNWSQPIWRFRTLFRDWAERPEPRALLEAEVFLDVRPVHGDQPVADLDRILVAAGSHGNFLAQMSRAAVTFRPPLGLFGRLPAKTSAIDIKRAGSAAIVLLARLYALAAGSTARTTALRLDAAAAGGTLSRVAADDMTDAYRFLTGLRLRHQVRQFRQGTTADNLVRLDELTAPEQRRLVEALRMVRDVQDVTAARFATHTVM
jgi:CBS domain-containing protein